MKIELELPDSYAEKLDEITAVDPTIEDQLEVELTADALRLINEAHRQLPDEPDVGTTGTSSDSSE